MMFDYYYGLEAEQFAFYRIPKLLFTDETFADVSVEAKMLYAILLDRMQLSVANGWLDEGGRVYIVFTIEQIQEAMGCGNKKAIRLLDELEKDAGLIVRKRYGKGMPNRIYVLNFISGVSYAQFKKCQNDISRSVKTTFLEVSKRHCNNTDINNTDYSDIDYSETEPDKPVALPVKKNRFTAFPKHHYTKQEMDELEEELLSISMGRLGKD